MVVFNVHIKSHSVKAANTPAAAASALAQRPFAKSVIIFIIPRPRTGIPLKIFYSDANFPAAAINFLLALLQMARLFFLLKPECTFNDDLGVAISFQFSHLCMHLNKVRCHYWERRGCNLPHGKQFADVFVIYGVACSCRRINQ